MLKFLYHVTCTYIYFDFFIPYVYPSNSLLLLYCFSWHSSTILKGSVEIGQLCLVAEVNVTASVFHFESDTGLGFLQAALILLMYVFCKPTLPRNFIVKAWCIFSKAFSVFIEMTLWFLCLNLLIWFMFINLQMLNKPCISEIKKNLDMVYNLFNVFCILLPNTLSSIFESLLISNLGL